MAISAPELTVQELVELFAASTGRLSSSREYRGVLLSFSRFAEEQGVVRGQELDFPLLLAYEASLGHLAPSTRHHRLCRRGS